MTKKKGGQPGNKNSVRHGAFIRRYDGRTVQGRLQREIEAALVTALGGDPSPQQILILQRCSVKALRCAIAEKEILRSNGDVSENLETHYLRWARELREDLKTLGLERRAKPVQDLQTYMKETHGT